MDQENKNSTGAPSNDTTSALFVSARKKQLEQQEAERRAKEKEDQRLAAEAEVRRLEREVEERRRKAEEESKQADEDAKRIAEEARAKKAQAAENPDAVLGAQPEKKDLKLPQIPKPSFPSAPKTAKSADTASSGGEAAAKAPLNTKMLAIIGGGVAVVILIVVLIVSMGGGDDAWLSEDEALDVLNEYDIAYYMDNGSEVWYGAFSDDERVQTADHLLKALKALGEKAPGIDKNLLASTMNEIYDAGGNPSMWAALGEAIGFDSKYYEGLLYPGSSGGQTDDRQTSGGQQASAVPAGFEAYEHAERGIAFYYPQGWEVTVSDNGDTSAVVDPILISHDGQVILIFNYTREYQVFLEEGGVDFEYFLSTFASDILEDLDYAEGDLSDISFNDYDEYADGSMDQGVSFTLKGAIPCFAVIRGEGNGVAKAVLALGNSTDERIDILNTVVRSIVISE